MQNYRQPNQSVKFFSKKFNFDKNVDLLLNWLEKRKIIIPDAIELPKLGFLIGAKDLGPIAIGFLRQCENNVGMIDSMITNPEIDPMIRNEAIDFLVLRLIAAAKQKQIYKIFGFSSDRNTLLRAQRLGFNLLSQKLVSLTVA